MLGVSQERAAPAAASTTASKTLDGTVSPAMLTSPRKRLSLPPAAPEGHCCPFPAGQSEEVEGEASPRQGAGSVWVMGLFLSHVKHSSAWGDELWGRGRCPNSMIFLEAGLRHQVFNRSYSPEFQPGTTGMGIGCFIALPEQPQTYKSGQ